MILKIVLMEVKEQCTVRLSLLQNKPIDPSEPRCGFMLIQLSSITVLMLQNYSLMKQKSIQLLNSDVITQLNLVQTLFSYNSDSEINNITEN